MQDNNRTMAKVQRQPDPSPFEDPTAAAAAIDALTRAHAMGLLSGKISRLDETALKGLERGLADAGIARGLNLELEAAANTDPERLSVLFKKISAALDESPVPDREWRAVERILGLESMAALIGISASSARRYFAGERTTPDGVAARLHFLAFVVGDLTGAYNDVGVRRWFHRPRRLLNGNSPAQLLVGNWEPHDDGPRQVRELAASIGASPAT